MCNIAGGWRDLQPHIYRSLRELKRGVMQPRSMDRYHWGDLSSDNCAITIKHVHCTAARRGLVLHTPVPEQSNSSPKHHGAFRNDN